MAVSCHHRAALSLISYLFSLISHCQVEGVHQAQKRGQVRALRPGQIDGAGLGPVFHHIDRVGEVALHIAERHRRQAAEQVIARLDGEIDPALGVDQPIQMGNGRLVQTLGAVRGGNGHLLAVSAGGEGAAAEAALPALGDVDTVSAVGAFHTAGVAGGNHGLAALRQDQTGEDGGGAGPVNGVLRLEGARLVAGEDAGAVQKIDLAGIIGVLVHVGQVADPVDAGELGGGQRPGKEPRHIRPGGGGGVVFILAPGQNSLFQGVIDGVLVPGLAVGGGHRVALIDGAGLGRHVDGLGQGQLAVGVEHAAALAVDEPQLHRLPDIRGIPGGVGHVGEGGIGHRRGEGRHTRGQRGRRQRQRQCGSTQRTKHTIHEKGSSFEVVVEVLVVFYLHLFPLERVLFCRPRRAAGSFPHFAQVFHIRQGKILVRFFGKWYTLREFGRKEVAGMEQVLFLMAAIWLAAVNLAGFILMGVDKSRAKRDAWRIPEKTLFLTAILGGSVGAIAGMFFFHHKTRHWYFRFGLPAILVVQLVAVGWLLSR